jgi:hypothetical protein
MSRRRIVDWYTGRFRGFSFLVSYVNVERERERERREKSQFLLCVSSFFLSHRDISYLKLRIEGVGLV